MNNISFFGTHLMVGDLKLRLPDNNNLRLMDESETPARFMRWVRQEEERLDRELTADHRLLSCPKHRLTREINRAMEKCCLWHFYGVR
jgi:hypothetical protein